MPERVFRFVRDGIEPSLFDVHSMLRLPIAGVCEANCSFAIVTMLLNVVSGASTLLYDSAEKPGKRFVKCLESFYPWTVRRFEDDVVDGPASGVMYHVFRNPFAHSFGLEVDRAANGRRIVRRGNVAKSVRRYQTITRGEGLTEDVLLDLEIGRDWPVWLGPTLFKVPRGYQVSAEALYRGVRLMLERMCREPAQMEHADHFLAGGH